MDFYHSKRWKQLRENVLKRDGYICQFTLQSQGQKREANTVHHIFPREEYPEYQWKPWNLISLSAEAHNMMHDRQTDELSDIGEELRQITGRKVGIIGQERTILIFGRPNAGKTTWVKHHLHHGIAYDLDRIAGAFTLATEEKRHGGARRLANSMLMGFTREAHKYSDTVFVIRTAPTIEEIDDIDPTEAVHILGGYGGDLPEKRSRAINRGIQMAIDYLTIDKKIPVNEVEGRMTP